MEIRFNCKKCGRGYIEPFEYEGSRTECIKKLEQRATEITEQCSCDDNGEWYWFEENRDAYSVESLNNEIKDTGKTVHDYIMYGQENGYFELAKSPSDMTTREISHLVDYIEYIVYLETN